MAKIFEQLRKSAFWSLDAVKGGNVRRHYKEIQFVLQNPESDQANEMRHESLSNILDHAIKTVPFYYNLSDSTKELDKFPVINKEVFRSNFEYFRSLEYKNKHAHEVRTSGSTGKPFRVLHDKNKRNRNTADTLIFAERAGFNLGEKLYYLRLWDKQYKKSRILTEIQNLAAYSVDDLTEDNLRKLVKDMETKGSNKNLLAYTSALNTVCKYIEKTQGKPLNCKMNSIIAIAEALHPDVKERVQKCFDSEVVSRYSNSENGIFAQQRPGSTNGSFEINWASYQVEILDMHEDSPVAPGEVGRIVVTDLFNYSMPMIRYDTGDVGIMNIDPDTGNLAFTKIDGRKMDMFTTTKGEYISSHIIHHILQFKGIEQFQFVEEENGEYIIKLKVSPLYDHEDEGRIRNQYKEYFGTDAVIHVQYVNDIPLLASGKRKLVVNNKIHSKKKSQKLTDEIKESVTPKADLVQ